MARADAESVASSRRIADRGARDARVPSAAQRRRARLARVRTGTIAVLTVDARRAGPARVPGEERVIGRDHRRPPLGQASRRQVGGVGANPDPPADAVLAVVDERASSRRDDSRRGTSRSSTRRRPAGTSCSSTRTRRMSSSCGCTQRPTSCARSTAASTRRSRSSHLANPGAIRLFVSGGRMVYGMSRARASWLVLLALASAVALAFAGAEARARRATSAGAVGATRPTTCASRR